MIGINHMGPCRYQSKQLLVVGVDLLEQMLRHPCQGPEHVREQMGSDCWTLDHVGWADVEQQ